MGQNVMRDAKNRFEYSTEWDDAVLADLDVDKASIYICVNEDPNDKSKKGFAAVLTVRGQQEGLVISGVTTEKGRNRGHLRAFAILLNEIEAHAEKFRGNIYVNNHFLWKIVNCGWCHNWLENGYLKMDGTPVANKDLIVPIAEHLYKDRMWYKMGTLGDYREFSPEQEYNVHRILKRINKLSQNYASAV